MSARPLAGIARNAGDPRRRLGSLALAPVEALLEALPELFAGTQDRQVARAPWRQANQLDVVAAVAVAACERLGLGEGACSPATVADAQERHLRRDSSRIASPAPCPDCSRST